MEKPKISDINWMCDLSEEFKEYFLDKAKLFKSDGGFEFHTIGSKNLHLVYQLSGTTNCNLFSDEYTSKTLLVTQGDWYGPNVLFEHTLKGQVRNNYSKNSTMLRWSSKEVDKIAKEHVEVYKLLFYIQRKRFFDFVQNLVINNSFSAETRVIYTLVDYGSRVKTISGSFPTIEATQQQIAKISGVSRQQVNQVIQHLINERAIEISRGKIHIINPAKLQSQLEQVDLPLVKPTLLE